MDRLVTNQVRQDWIPSDFGDYTLLVLTESGSGYAPAKEPHLEVLKTPDCFGPGGDLKLAFRYAIEQGFDSIYVVGQNAECSQKLLPLMKQGLSEEKNDAVFCFENHRQMKQFKNGIPRYGVMAAQTAALKQVPFERNSNDSLFFCELAKQLEHRGRNLVHFVVPGVKQAHDAGYWKALKVSIHSRLHQAGFFYDRKFDTGEHHYPQKLGRYSSHAKILNSVSRGSKVLDLGCGRGFLASGLVGQGCTVHGVDILAPEKVGESISRYFQIDLNKNPEQIIDVLRGESYDVILMADILEHLVDPERYLSILRENTPWQKPPKFLVCTANVAFVVVRSMLAFGQFNYGPRGILDRTHTRLFTRKSFDLIFRQAGFEIKKKSWVPMPFQSIFQNEHLAGLLEWMNQALANLRPGLFSYQMLFTVKALPTTQQLLTASQKQ